MRFPLNVPMRPSKGAMASVLVIHAVAGLALFHMRLPAPWMFYFAAVLVGASALAGLLQELAKGRCTLRLEGDGGITLMRDGRSSVARARAGAVDFGWAIWLGLSPVAGEALSWRFRRLMLLPGNLPAAQWRPLRIWLRHRAFKPEA